MRNICNVANVKPTLAYTHMGWKHTRPPHCTYWTTDWTTIDHSRRYTGSICNSKSLSENEDLYSNCHKSRTLFTVTHKQRQRKQHMKHIFKKNKLKSVNSLSYVFALENVSHIEKSVYARAIKAIIIIYSNIKAAHIAKEQIINWPSRSIILTCISLLAIMYIALNAFLQLLFADRVWGHFL